jgi:hypothetical protein
MQYMRRKYNFRGRTRHKAELYRVYSEAPRRGTKGDDAVGRLTRVMYRKERSDIVGGVGRNDQQAMRSPEPI